MWAPRHLIVSSSICYLVPSILSIAACALSSPLLASLLLFYLKFFSWANSISHPSSSSSSARVYILSLVHFHVMEEVKKKNWDIFFCWDPAWVVAAFYSLFMILSYGVGFCSWLCGSSVCFLNQFDVSKSMNFLFCFLIWYSTTRTFFFIIIFVFVISVKTEFWCKINGWMVTKSIFEHFSCLFNVWITFVYLFGFLVLTESEYG